MERKVPFKNYVILAVILIITIIITILFFKSYWNNEKNNLISNNEYLRTINYNELDNYLVENKDVVIYVSSSNDKRIIDFEEKLESIVTKYALNNVILNLNLNSNNSIKIKNDKVTVPSIIICKDGKLVSSFNIKENDYNTNKLIEYLKIEMIISD